MTYQRLGVPEPTGNIATDFANLKTFCNDAPAGATIEFPINASYTLHAGWWTPKSRQTWLGNRATIKRAAEVATTSTATVNNGATALPVSSTAGWLVGMTVTIGDAARTTGWNVAECRVVSVGAGVLNLSRGVSLANNAGQTVASLPAGSVVASKGAMLGNRAAALSGLPTGVCIERLELDGNAAQNTSINRWETQSEIDLCSDDGRLFGVVLHNCSGEGVVLSGRNGYVHDVKLLATAGNGVHLSDLNGTMGAFDWKLANVVSDGACSDSGLGHSGGGIIASNNVLRTTLQMCDTLNSKRFGIGSWDSTNNAYAEVHAHRARKCDWGAWEFGTSAGQVASKLRVVGGEFVDCGTDETNLGQITTVNAATNVEVVGGYYENCPIIVKNGGKAVSFTGVQFNTTVANRSFINAALDIANDNVTVTGCDFTGTAGTAGLMNAIRVNGTRRGVLIVGNSMTGHNMQVFVNGQSYACQAANNRGSDWYTAHFWQNQSGAQPAGGWNVTGNVLWGSATQATHTSTAGAVVLNLNAGSRRTHVSGNQILLEKTGGNAHHGIMFFAPGRAFVQGNDINVAHAGSQTVHSQLCATAGSVVLGGNALNKAPLLNGVESRQFDSVNGAALSDSNRVY